MVLLRSRGREGVQIDQCETYRVASSGSIALCPRLQRQSVAMAAMWYLVDVMAAANHGSRRSSCFQGIGSDGKGSWPPRRATSSSSTAQQDRRAAASPHGSSSCFRWRARCVGNGIYMSCATPVLHRSVSSLYRPVDNTISCHPPSEHALHAIGLITRYLYPGTYARDDRLRLDLALATPVARVRCEPYCCLPPARQAWLVIRCRRICPS